MTTYTEFVTFFRSGLPEIHVNVSAWSETTEFRGALRRAFSGMMLSTLHTGKRKIQATLEFPTSVEYDAFMTFIATDVAGGTGTLTGLSTVFMLGRGTDSAIRNRTISVYVEPGQATATDEVQSGNVVRPHWSLNVTIYQV